MDRIKYNNKIKKTMVALIKIEF